MQRAATWTIALLLLAGHAGIQAQLAWDDSETIDEPEHLVAALLYTQRGTFRLYNVNPPLSRLVQGLFVLGGGFDTSMLAESTIPGERLEGQVGANFAHANADRFREAIFRARLGTILFSLLGGVLLWRTGNRLFGEPCGLLALFLWCVDPYVLANGHLATPDLPVAVVTFAAVLTHAAYLRDPSWRWAVLSGVMLGAAILSKFTMVLLLPVWGLSLSFATRQARAWHGWLALATTLLVLNMGYLFQDTCRRVENYRVFSSKFAWLGSDTLDTLRSPTNVWGGTWIGAIPVPLPAPMVEGMDLQAFDFDRYAGGRARFFMAGAWYEGGRWWYYLYCLAVKSSLGQFGLLVMGGVLLARWRERPPLFLFLAVPLATIAFVSSQTGMNKHVRYVLPAIPFLILIAGAAGRAKGRWRAIVVLLLVWAALAGVRATRDPLAYFNELAGGPRGGTFLLAGSNLDFGQGRYRLRVWLEAHPDFRPVYVAAYCSVYQGILDREYGIPSQEPKPGRYAVSVRYLQNDLRWLMSPRSSDAIVLNPGLGWLLHCKPVATAGDSVWLFDVSPAEASRVRQEMEQP